MQTHLADFIRNTPSGEEAESILRTCVHCGFCTATCPTYQLLGNELDGPRGRIYLIKSVLEGAAVTETTQRHLDRCLTCRACETTCPSGVRYARLLDIGRAVVDDKVGRKAGERVLRYLLRAILARPRRLAPLVRVAQLVRPLLPPGLRRRVPAPISSARIPTTRVPGDSNPECVIALEGCVQSVLAPEIDAATARVLDRFGISMLQPPGAGCCGALSYHLGALAEGLDFMRANIDAWWPAIEDGAQAIIATSSACAATIKEYGELLARDARYADKAARVSELARDPAQLFDRERLERLAASPPSGRRVAFHSPCTLVHGQGLVGAVEQILAASGYQLTTVADAHLCCGSAGTYSVLQPALSARLLQNKLEALGRDAPRLIATANIGCLLHLRSGTSTPVVHWMQLVDERLREA